MEVDPRAALRSRNSSIGSMLALGAVTILAVAGSNDFILFGDVVSPADWARYPVSDVGFFQNQPRHRNHSSGTTALIAISYNPVRMAGFHWVIDLQ